jgi:hypothetical protein
MLVDWFEVTKEALLGLWQGFINFTPNLIGALIVFLIGWLVSAGFGRLVAEILRKAKFDKIFEKGSWDRALEKADIKADVSDFIGAIFKWILMLVFLLAAVQILGLFQFAVLITNVLNYLPNVIIAVLIFVVTVIIVDILEKIVRTTIEGSKVGYGRLAGSIVKWSIWVFAILIILYQLGVAQPFMTDLFRGVVVMIVISVGLAFGLGGRDVAAEVIRDLKEKLEK